MGYNKEAWNRLTLGDFISLQRGHDLTDKERQNGNIPVIGAAGQNGYHNKALALAPGIVVGRSGGSFGKVHFIKKDYWPHNTALYVTDFKGNDPYFTYYLLKLLDFSSLNSGSAQPSLNRNYLYPISVVVPKPLKQQSIGKVLSSLDDKIELNNKINTELEAMAKLLYDYWFVQFDFPDANGKPYKSSGGKMVYNKRLKREIPEGWEDVCIGDLGEFKNGINYDPSEEGDTQARIINVRNISSSSTFISNEDLDEIWLKGSDVKKYLVENKSIIIARSGIPGATRLIVDYKENTIYCGFIICFSVSEINLKNIIFYQLKNVEKSMANQSGGTIMKNVNQGTLRGIKLALPNKDQLHIIKNLNNILNPMFAKMNLVQKENQQLTELRDWLLPMLMNGQVRVG